MVDVVLSPQAMEELPRIQAAGGADSTAIVITPDQAGEGLAARFVDLSTLRVLKTRFMKEIYPGVEVHAFGLEDLPEEGFLELVFAPSRDTGNGSGQPFERNLSYNFTVAYRPAEKKAPVTSNR